MTEAIAPRIHDDDWHAAVHRINAILETQRLKSSAPLAVFAAKSPCDRDGSSVAAPRLVYGPEDVAWDIADWIARHHSGDRFGAVLEAHAAELSAGLDCETYALEPAELFQTFMVFYLSAPDAAEPYRIAPRFCTAFENWLAATDHGLLSCLRRLRLVCRTYRLHHPD